MNMRHEVNTPHSVPQLGGRIEIAERCYASVRKHYINAPKTFNRSVNQSADRILAANITGEALTANLLRNKSSHSAVDIGHHDLSASGCKLNAQRFTNTIGTSCNNYRFSRQSHQSSPIYFMPQFRSKLYD
jgi:hypothetical protein